MKHELNGVISAINKQRTEWAVSKLIVDSEAHTDSAGKLQRLPGKKLDAAAAMSTQKFASILFSCPLSAV